MNEWTPGVQYNQSDVVVYQGKTYKAIRPHMSQSDWVPEITPSLWVLFHD
ncbi:hypothetical protein BDV38DRAFT_288433 [Aspergillus pseudotamarii]|uniref:Chitin-binding type-3 domain-containing protein n=1 Tax=Aspergillus pseudotamarii TaxID=132259 RepID=A0A5N6SF27_ASPPS|nr:uncharacterized protein BDV38DRAFT_288433 [Aspergillus pseudotamarii]KAE8131714.1 hypothetical protein BDV38DRAFT_288433 [Aspergillus pseudotamarii]